MNNIQYKKTTICIFLLCTLICSDGCIDIDSLNASNYNNVSLNDLKNESFDNNKNMKNTFYYSVECKNIKKISTEHSYINNGKYVHDDVHLDVLPVYITNTRNEILTINPNYISIVYEDGAFNNRLSDSFIMECDVNSKDYYNTISIWHTFYSIPPDGCIIYNILFNRIDLDKNPTFVIGITRYNRQGDYIGDETIKIKLSGLEYIIV